MTAEPFARRPRGPKPEAPGGRAGAARAETLVLTPRRGSSRRPTAAPRGASLKSERVEAPGGRPKRPGKRPRPRRSPPRRSPPKPPPGWHTLEPSALLVRFLTFTTPESALRFVSLVADMAGGVAYSPFLACSGPSVLIQLGRVDQPPDERDRRFAEVVNQLLAMAEKAAETRSLAAEEVEE